MGYSLNLFLVIVIGNLSLFFFSYPSTLPKIFYLTPHACIIRGLYYQVKACVEGQCISGFREIEVEHWFNLVLPYLHFLVYFAVGLMNYDQKMFSRIKSVIDFRRNKDGGTEDGIGSDLGESLDNSGQSHREKEAGEGSIEMEEKEMGNSKLDEMKNL